MTSVTLDVLKAVFPATSSSTLQTFVEPFNKAASKFEINTALRMAAFLSQTGHESAGLKFVAENLNYSTDSLLRVFPKYFKTRTLAESYARQPAKIAARVYGGRMGNGAEATGEGWKFRGRGLIQLTGKNNYTSFANAMGMTLDEAVAYLETPEGACMSAAWFWSTNGLNALADKSDVVSMTKRINGGTNGLEDRQALYMKAKKALGI